MVLYNELNITQSSFAKGANIGESSTMYEGTTTNLSARMQNVTSNTNGLGKRLYKVKPMQSPP